MSNLKLRIKLNKGGRGVSLDKLEKFVAEMRKFLFQIGTDLGIPDPKQWVGVDFENSSLAFTNESGYAASPEVLTTFNDSIRVLAGSAYPPYILDSTSEQFFKMASALGQGETADIAVFGQDGNAQWMEISYNLGTLSQKTVLLPYRIAEGSIQGTIHNIFVQTAEPYFTLRELSSQKLIKCFFGEDDYAAVVQTLHTKGQLIHVRGTIVTDTHERSVHHVTVSRIIPAEPYGYSDLEKFLGVNWRQ